MSYSDFIGIVNSPNKEQISILKQRCKSSNTSHDYEFVRYGLPSGPVKFEEVKLERERLIKHFISNGYTTCPYDKLSNNFRKHVAMLRASLDLWYELCGPGSMSREEIYFRCLSEGPAFSDWVKKSRSMTLKYHSSETNTPIEEEYLLHGYKGYNSMISEDYLIHWDDSDSVDDIKYAFIESKPIDEQGFRKRVKKLFSDFRISECEFPEEYDMLGMQKASSMYDPVKKRSFLMREFWNDSVEAYGPYFARRTVVPVSSCNTRDTGVGDPSTILKVKQLNALSRVISERLPYSANAPEELCNSRLKRILKRNAFLHLDFKKFGLTFPRSLMNIMIEEIGNVSGIDIDHLLIKKFFVEIDGETYQTSRGTMLGWLDCINSLCVIAILHWISSEEELGFDFISFNDDVEISKYAVSDVPGTLELLRLAIVSELHSFDIPISLSKTYGSRGSIFLERYAHFSKSYQLDMYKEQLTVKAYTKSLCTEFPWQAKLFHAAAEQWTKNEYATDRCIKTCPVEFRHEEASTSLWSGGWFIKKIDGLDNGITETDRKGYMLGIELSKFKNQNYATRIQKVSPWRKIRLKVENDTHNSYSAEMGKLQFTEVETLDEINSDIELIRECLQTYLFNFSGRDDKFPLRVSWLVERSLGDGRGIT